jgi:hypothetical protein
MWSGRYDEDNVKRDIGDAMPRIFDWRYRLLKRGIQTEAIQPLWWYVFVNCLSNYTHFYFLTAAKTLICVIVNFPQYSKQSNLQYCFIACFSESWIKV